MTNKTQTEECQEAYVAYDNKNLVRLILAKGIKPLKVTADGPHLSFFFKTKEVLIHKDELLSARPIPCDYQQVIAAEEAWNRAVIMAKSGGILDATG